MDALECSSRHELSSWVHSDDWTAEFLALCAAIAVVCSFGGSYYGESPIESTGVKFSISCCYVLLLTLSDWRSDDFDLTMPPLLLPLFWSSDF